LLDKFIITQIKSSGSFVGQTNNRLNVERAVQIDVFGWFFNLAFSGTYQWVFSIFPENERSRKQIDRRLRRSSIYFTLCKI